jgi:ribosome-binding protein aMBF1 (putative translation factor)
MTQPQRLLAASPDAVLDDYCPICGRPDNYCEICGAPHDERRQHVRLAGEEVRFSRDDMIAVEREAVAWEDSREYETDVAGVRAHTARLRALAQKISTVLQYTD